MTHPRTPGVNDPISRAAPKPVMTEEQTIRHLALQEAVKTWKPATTDEQLVTRARAFANFIQGGS